MYWRNQEEIIFYIVLFILVVFQASSAIVLNDSHSVLASPMLTLLVLNALLLFGMVLYARWVWKGLSIFRVLFKILVFELFVVVLVFCIFIARPYL